jgi:hypothetical protein
MPSVALPPFIVKPVRFGFNFVSAPQAREDRLEPRDGFLLVAFLQIKHKLEAFLLLAELGLLSRNGCSAPSSCHSERSSRSGAASRWPFVRKPKRLP